MPTFWIATPPTLVLLLHSSSLSRAADELKMMSAHCKVLMLAGWPNTTSVAGVGETYVVERSTSASNLHNHQACRHTLQVRRSQVGFLQSCFQIRLSGLLQTERAIASLVEPIHKRNVEGGNVLSQAKIDICERPLVMDLHFDGAASDRPLCAVAEIRLIDTRAWIGVSCKWRLV